MIKYILILSTLLLIYSCKQSNSKTTLPLQDSINFNSTTIFDKHLLNILKQIKETNLVEMEKSSYEFRFYYFPSYENNKLFKLNFLDSTLVVKEFIIEKPDGTGKDSLISFKKIKFNNQDFETLYKLIEKSMFLNLECNIEKLSIDGSLYIYELKQPIQLKVSSIKKEYQIVRYNNPKNFDFVNLGQFFLFKTGYKNIYKD